MDGVAIGSPLAPGLANIFMGLHDSKWLDEYNLNKPKFYFRYVDDISIIKISQIDLYRTNLKF